MAHGKDYVPTKDAEFDAWFKFLIRYVAKKCSIIPPAAAAEWTHIPAEVRTALGIPNHDAIPSPIKPTTRPEFALTLKDIRQIGIVFRDQGKSSKHRAIPYGMNGAVGPKACSFWAQSESGERGDYSELQSAVIPQRDRV